MVSLSQLLAVSWICTFDLKGWERKKYIGKKVLKQRVLVKLRRVKYANQTKL